MTVTVEIGDLMPAAPADLVGVGWVAEVYNVAIATVHSAIRDGRLSATEVPGGRGRIVYAIRPQDAFAVWGGKYVSARLSAVTDDEHAVGQTADGTDDEEDAATGVPLAHTD